MRLRDLGPLLRHGLPQQCALCAADSGNALVCNACIAALPRLPPACPVCALPTPAGDACVRCATRPPPFARTVAPCIYAYPLDRLLQGLKYAGRLALADFFASLIATSVCAWPDRLIALPLSRQRQRERGYNQAREIARGLARRGAVPLDDALIRVRETPAQASLAWSDRARNVRGAFAATRALDGLRVAIVDDVMTTGATLHAAAVAARRAGACAVEAWVVARTLPPET